MLHGSQKNTDNRRPVPIDLEQQQIDKFNLADDIVQVVTPSQISQIDKTGENLMGLGEDSNRDPNAMQFDPSPIQLPPHLISKMTKLDDVVDHDSKSETDDDKDKSGTPGQSVASGRISRETEDDDHSQLSIDDITVGVPIEQIQNQVVNQNTHK